MYIHLNKLKNKIKYLINLLVLLLILLSFSKFGFSTNKNNKELIEEEIFLKSELNLVNEIESLNKYSQSVLKSAASISIIQLQELKYFFYLDIKRLLNFSPGLYIVEDGAYWYLGSKGVQIPGSYNSRALFLFNGITLNEPLFGTSVDIPTYLVNNIEIVFRFSNVYFGSNSLLATINIVPNYKNLNNQFYSNSFINFNDNKINTLNNFTFNKTLTKKYDNYLKLSLGISLLNYKGSKVFFKEREELALDSTAYYIDKSYQNYFYISLFSEDSEFHFNSYENKYHFPTGAYNTVFNSFETNILDNYYNLLYRKKIKLDTNKTINLTFYNQKFKEIGTELKNLSFKLNNFDENYTNRHLINEYLNLEKNQYSCIQYILIWNTP